MDKVFGRYINLASSKRRRKEMQEQFMQLGVVQFYKRFEAETGDEYIAQKKNLKKGELGLWRSWLKLLNEEANNLQDYEYLHILEDDAVLSNEFIALANNLNKWENKYDLLVTDMYVNPSIYGVFDSTYKSLMSKRNIILTEKNYTGCTSSCLIPKHRIKKIS